MWSFLRSVSIISNLFSVSKSEILDLCLLDYAYQEDLSFGLVTGFQCDSFPLGGDDCVPHPLQCPKNKNIKGEMHSPWQIKATQYTHTEEKDQQLGISRFSFPR